MRIALVVMPFASAERPSLAAGLLSAAVKSRGIGCDTKHFNVTLSRMLGAGPYKYLSESAPTTALAGEWVFSQLFYGPAFSTWETYEKEVLDHPSWGMHRKNRVHVTDLFAQAPTFLTLALESSDWSAYDLVGFTSTFEQTLPALCLARAIKRLHPPVKIALGGANFEAGMGRPYLDHYPFLDFVCTGEGDVAFPALCESLRDGRTDVPPGILGRGEPPAAGGTRAFVSLDALPLPDFDDYFRVHAASGNGGARKALTIPIEASRGCWWGQKAHCTFCGLNGEGMPFRKKSAARVIEEVDALTARYRPSLLQFADNILGMDFLDDLLPEWASREKRPRTFFEIKSNLRRTQVDLLGRAGVSSVQAGIESFSDRSLKLMRKGVSGAQNVALLRWAKEARVLSLWNLIFGFPKETPEDYLVNETVMRKLVHLDPPNACASIRLDRFSPNFTSPAEHGFRDVRPVPAYRHVFPMPEETLREVASYFDYDHDQRARVPQLSKGIVSFGETWREKAARGETGRLDVLEAGGGHRLVDTRFNRAAVERPLTAVETALLLATDAPTSRERAVLAASRVLPGSTTTVVESSLDALVHEDAIAAVGESLVTLALLPRDLSLGELARAR